MLKRKTASAVPRLSFFVFSTDFTVGLKHILMLFRYGGDAIGFIGNSEFLRLHTFRRKERALILEKRDTPTTACDMQGGIAYKYLHFFNC